MGFKKCPFLAGFNCPLTGRGQLQITSISGKLVKRMNADIAQKGTISLVWDIKDTRGRILSNGVYLAKLHVNGKTLIEKFTLSKNVLAID